MKSYFVSGNVVELGREFLLDILDKVANVSTVFSDNFCSRISIEFNLNFWDDSS